jgi:two-component system, NarL family, invasion response regulator UvrY
MKVLVADDHTIVREGLKQIVKSLDVISQTDEAASGDEAWKMIRNGSYDLIILDISMPGMNGLEVVKKIRDNGIQSHVLVLSVYPQEQYAVRAINLGASGYITKDSAYTELALAIKKIASGGRYISSAFAEKHIFSTTDETAGLPHEKLSEREFQVMMKLVRGQSVTEIANEISISDKTVSTYRVRILEKLGLRNNAEMTLYAVRNNLIE